MIREFIKSLRTPASRAARRLGYVYESIALQERYRRRRKSWQDHLRKCHEITLSEIEKSGARQTLVILGSGPLLEIPMDELIKRFSKIHLIDIVHPLEVRSKWGAHPKIALVEMDLTGVAEELSVWRGGALPKPNPPSLESLNADFILSANCLSQLALRPRQHAERTAPVMELDAFCEAISAAHIRQIKELKTSHLIIADYETEVMDKNGNIIERSTPFFEPAEMKMTASWPWTIAPRGEIHRRNSAQMKVGAFRVQS